jgi:hypothetical protein
MVFRDDAWKGGVKLYLSSCIALCVCVCVLCVCMCVCVCVPALRRIDLFLIVWRGLLMTGVWYLGVFWSVVGSLMDGVGCLGGFGRWFAVLVGWLMTGVWCLGG